MIAFGGRRGPHRSGSRCRGRPIERREAGREGCLWPNAASQGRPPDGSGGESERSTPNGRAKILWWWWWCAHQLLITSGRLPRIWGSISRVESLVLGALSSSPVHRALVLVLGTNIAVLLDCSSRLDSVAFLPYLLTYLALGEVSRTFEFIYGVRRQKK